jgi:hypothetical protein
MAAKAITRTDVLSMEDYGKIRAEKRKNLVETKRHRRMAVGPHATWYFECYETMWWQIHEMLFIERGGEAQIGDELQAYNPLIPNGRELVATIMFEINDPAVRKAVLDQLGGIEETFFISIDGVEVTGVAEEDVDRTSATGKASSVQFAHFPMSDEQVAAFQRPGAQIMVGSRHPNYGHIALMPELARTALADDLD